MTSVALDGLIAQMAADYGFDMVDASRLEGLVPGYAIDRIMALRDALQPLELAYFLDSLESSGSIVLRPRGSAETVASLTEDDLVEEKAGAPRMTVTRAQETDLPASAKISFISSEGDYRQAMVEARRLAGASGRVSQAELPIVLDPDAASELAESWLFDAWSSRERTSFVLPPSCLAVRTGRHFERRSRWAAAITARDGSRGPWRAVHFGSQCRSGGICAGGPAAAGIGSPNTRHSRAA